MPAKKVPSAKKRPGPFTVVVVGAGKMGLPLACRFAARGARVIACDKDEGLVAAINAGRCPIDEPGLRSEVRRLARAKRLTATTDTAAAVRQAQAVVVIVPAKLTGDREIDGSALEAAARAIAKGLQKRTLVSFETTVPVGYTRAVLRPLLETSGIEAGNDFDLVFSPERVKSGTVLESLGRTPKVLGAQTPEAAKRAVAFYKKYLGAPVVDLGSLEAAELLKLAGMLYRDVNIALSNELAAYAEAAGIDLHPVIEAANTDGETFMLKPGIGVGGHCTPVYPHFIIGDGRRRGAPLLLAERARFVNDNAAIRTLDRVERVAGSLRGRRALILGLAFRPGVKEHSYSTAFILHDELERRGALPRVADPLYSDEELAELGFEPGRLDSSAHMLILNTAHPQYKTIDFQAAYHAGARIFLDGRNGWNAARIRAAGLHYFGVGMASPPGEEPAWPIPLARPKLGAEETVAADRVIGSGWLMMGPEVAAFEKEFAASVGAPFACAVSSGTAALHLALLAVGVKPGDEVVTASHSFIATANSIRLCGATPVFADIEPDSFNLEPESVELSLSPKTKAILAVHQLGRPCDLRALSALAKKHKVALVEDAACAVGSEILWEGAWEKIGRPHGHVACFSFHPRKVLTTGDGGMVTTNNPDIDHYLRLARNHGMNRLRVPGAPPESYDLVGWNYRMTDLQAAIGREQLKRLPGIIRRRRELAARYGELLRDLPVGLPSEPDWARSNWQTYTVRLPDRMPVQQMIDKLFAAGIGASRGVRCAHLEKAYADAGWVCRCGGLMESELATATTLALPLYPDMTDIEQRLVTAAVSTALIQEPIA